MTGHSAASAPGSRPAHVHRHPGGRCRGRVPGPGRGLRRHGRRHRLPGRAAARQPGRHGHPAAAAAGGAVPRLGAGGRGRRPRRHRPPGAHAPVGRYPYGRRRGDQPQRDDPVGCRDPDPAGRLHDDPRVGARTGRSRAGATATVRFTASNTDTSLKTSVDGGVRGDYALPDRRDQLVGHRPHRAGPRAGADDHRGCRRRQRRRSTAWCPTGSTPARCSTSRAGGRALPATRRPTARPPHGWPGVATPSTSPSP